MMKSLLTVYNAMFTYTEPLNPPPKIDHGRKENKHSNKRSKIIRRWQADPWLLLSSDAIVPCVQVQQMPLRRRCTVPFVAGTRTRDAPPGEHMKSLRLLRCCCWTRRSLESFFDGERRRVRPRWGHRCGHDEEEEQQQFGVERQWSGEDKDGSHGMGRGGTLQGPESIWSSEGHAGGGDLYTRREMDFAKFRPWSWPSLLSCPLWWLLHSTILKPIWKGILEKWSSGRGCSNSSSCDADLIHQTTQRWNIDFGSLPICQWSKTPSNPESSTEREREWTGGPIHFTQVFDWIREPNLSVLHPFRCS